MTNLDEDIVEKIADFMHDQWSHWMKYQFSKMEETYHYETKKQTGMFMPFEFVVRWMRQMETSYSELTEKEKDSDREWAIKLLGLLSKTHELRDKRNCTNCDEYAGEDHLCSRMI